MKGKILPENSMSRTSIHINQCMRNIRAGFVTIPIFTTEDDKYGDAKAIVTIRLPKGVELDVQIEIPFSRNVKTELSLPDALELLEQVTYEVKDGPLYPEQGIKNTSSYGTCIVIKGKQESDN